MSQNLSCIIGALQSLTFLLRHCVTFPPFSYPKLLYCNLENDSGSSYFFSLKVLTHDALTDKGAPRTLAITGRVTDG